MSIDFIKIILLGDSGVGKTSLINRYIKNQFNVAESSTIGAALSVKTYENERIQFWDTAGQETYRSVTDLYLRDSQAIILVVDSSAEESEFKNIDEHIKKIADLAPDSSVIIAANKADLEPNNFAKKPIEYYEHYQTLIKNTNTKQTLNIKFLGVFNTSAKDGEGVNVVFETAMNAAIEHYLETNKDNDGIVKLHADYEKPTLHPRKKNCC